MRLLGLMCALAACPLLATALGLRAATAAAISIADAVRVSADDSDVNVTESEVRLETSTEDRAWRMIHLWNSRAKSVYNAAVSAEWNYATNQTDEGQDALLSKMEEFANLSVSQSFAFRQAFPSWRAFQNSSLRIALRKLTRAGYAALPLDDYSKYSRLQTEMELKYSNAAVCRNGKNPLELDQGLMNLMANSIDYDEKLWAWKGWHDAIGPATRPLYSEFVLLLNKAAISNGYQNLVQLWQSEYDTNDPGDVYALRDDVQRLYEELRPLYTNLHFYVKNKLKGVYGDHRFPSEGHIPAHILGDLWAQRWQSLAKIVQPYGDAPGADPSVSLRNRTVEQLLKISEEYFVSLGLKRLPHSFWEKSMFTKPKDRRVACHPTAWNFFDGSDVRLKMCADSTMESYISMHHEMGHVQYYLHYGHLPVVFQDAPNPGFQEAVGDVIGMSAVTPRNLLRLGLINHDSIGNKESDINFLMSMALETISPLPFAKIVDEWRWSVLTNTTSANDYNKKWWHLRCKYQGVSPPILRTEHDFDPAALYHISANVPFVSYFISTILQYQFHRSLCKASNHTGPLHTCDIYGSKKAGDLLRGLFALGASVSWPDALQQVTGVRHMDGGAILEYFRPLFEWLQEQNKGNGDLQWNEAKCPDPPDIDVPSGECLHYLAAVEALESGSTSHDLKGSQIFVLYVLAFHFYSCVL